MYSVFTRNWWKPATTPGWPNQLEPDPRARRRYIARGLSYDAARALAREWNNSHPAGKLSRKAELEET